MNPAIEQGKRAIKARVQAELSGKLAELRKRHPDKNTPALWKELQASEPELIAYASRIEAGQWTREPVRRYAGSAVIKAKRQPVDDRQVYIVMAGNEVVDIKLE